MMILYLLLLLMILAARVLVARRASRLEKRYARAAQQARDLLSQPQYRQGNNNRPDVAAQARQQYLLGQAVEQRDRVEARYLVWQARSESLGKVLTRVRSWKGRVVPYVSGVIDVALALVLLNLLGIVEWSALAEVMETLKSRLGG